MKGLFPYLVDRDITVYEANRCLRKMITALEKGEMIAICEPSRNIRRVGQELKKKIGTSANVIVRNPIIIMEHKSCKQKD